MATCSNDAGVRPDVGNEGLTKRGRERVFPEGLLRDATLSEALSVENLMMMGVRVQVGGGWEQRSSAAAFYILLVEIEMLTSLL